MIGTNPNTHTTAEPKLELVVQPYTAVYMLDGDRHLILNASNTAFCARYIARYLKLPYFFSPGVGLVEVDEEPLFGGWRCSPVTTAELTKMLRENIKLMGLNPLQGDWYTHSAYLYDHFARELAGSSKANRYFPELKGMVFTGHTTSDGSQLKRRGYDRRTGLFVMAKRPFRSANDERMAVAA